MKEYKCVQVNHHNKVAEKIDELQIQGWILHTYQTTQRNSLEINHYLLFERGK